mgnify:CR=1 FL=1
MKIAVTYENGQVFQHFGHTESFKIYQTGGKDIESEEVVGTGGSGHGALAGFLKERDVNVLICGGIGGGAKNALACGICLRRDLRPSRRRRGSARRKLWSRKMGLVMSRTMIQFLPKSLLKKPFTPSCFGTWGFSLWRSISMNSC